MENILKTDHYNLQKDLSQKLLIVKQIGFAKVEEHKKIWAEVMAQILQNNLEKLYINGTEAKVLQPEVQTWFEKEYFPEVAKKMVNRKLKIARLLPEDIFMQFVGEKLEKMIEKQVSNIENGMFRYKEQAEEWLGIDVK